METHEPMYYAHLHEDAEMWEDIFFSDVFYEEPSIRSSPRIDAPKLQQRNMAKLRHTEESEYGKA